MMKLLRKLRNSKRGFSLVELIVVIAIMAVIAVILIPSLLRYVEDSRAEKDVKTTDEVVTAVELALADQDIYDELVEHSVWDNVSCYVDKDSESGYEKTVIKETYNGHAEQYMFDDDARQNDEVPYYGAGNMRGLTITLSPTKDSNESTYELSRAIINRFVGRKTGYLYECEKLYNNVRSIVGDTIQNSSQTYRNSDFTIFIRLGSAGGNEAGNQDATQVWGQYNGTNLPADTVQTAKITTDRVIGDAGQYDKDVNDYINDEANTDIDFSKLAEMGGSNFGKDLSNNKISYESLGNFEHKTPNGTIEPHDTEEGVCSKCNQNVLAAGLYDENDNLIVSWADSGIKNTCSNAKTKINGTYQNTRKVVISNDVTSINQMAFYQCSNLISVEMPSSVMTIGRAAFAKCTALISVNISNNITLIDDNTFSECSNLTKIEIPNSVTSIGMMAFAGCTNLTSIEIPNNVTSIGESALASTGLTSINVPDTVTNLGDGVFYGCTNLRTINLGNGITNIGFGEFSECTNLTEIIIPKNVTLIDNYAFENCTSLTKITIPESVTSIGLFVLQYCDNFKEINYLGTQSQWNAIEIAPEWNRNGPQITVHCTDGDIVIPANK